MRRLLAPLLLLALVDCTRQAPPARVAIVGIDGAAWANLDPLIERGALPNLARLRREGATAELVVDSAQSPESWTSLATGHHPPEHGIQQQPGVEGSTFAATAQQLKVKRLWDMAGERGRRVLVANYWVTGKVYPVNGVMIGRESDETFPPEIQRLNRPDWQPGQHGERIRQLALGAAKTGLMEAALDHDPDLDLVILPIYAYDQALHMLWDEWEAGELLEGDHPPPGLTALPADQQARIREGHGVVLETAKLADRLVGLAMRYAGEDGYVMLVSDHGHRAADPSMRRVAISRSLLDGRPGTAEQGRFTVDGVTVTLEPVEHRSRPPIPQLGYVLRYPRLTFEGEGAEAVRERFLALTDEAGAPLFRPEGAALAPADALLAHAHSALGRYDTDAFSIFVNSGAHGIEDHGVFGLLGPDVQAGPIQSEVDSVDVTPTALWLLDLPVGRDLAGAPVTAALSPAGQEARRVEQVDTYEDGTRPWVTPQMPGITPEERERLKALGYIQGE
ncbi:MAG: alkaline phosphatase family protein [Alphaproteobacteria bacterium]|nr:alkaline phosphatase family protein [Alphaproteobacteria bacterium]